MYVFKGYIISRPSKASDGKTVPAALVGEIAPFVAMNLDQARTAATAKIAQNEKLAHVLSEPENFQVQLVQEAASATF